MCFHVNFEGKRKRNCMFNLTIQLLCWILSVPTKGITSKLRSPRFLTTRHYKYLQQFHSNLECNAFLTVLIRSVWCFYHTKWRDKKWWWSHRVYWITAATIFWCRESSSFGFVNQSAKAEMSVSHISAHTRDAWYWKNLITD